ncbi:hypothetical protein [Novosphingobium sp. AP12]|uniref:hypothetical protein n=1 Tax=Novosphingobium sp. AP12 TaxID=1144305 RepID=UPI000272155B|nr:hypothetical protein [Novosphingobium sp. AP12]EJL22465.1 hypothetical protein PMI02_04697 [Novosphingobium sp. AP12]
MRKFTKIVAPALVALLGMASLAPTVAEAAPRHHDQRVEHRKPLHHARHAPKRHVEKRRVTHHRVAHRAPPRHVAHHAPVHHDRRHR